MTDKPQFDGEWVKLGDCFPYIRNGYSVKQDKSTGGLPITRIETISGGRFNRDRVGYAGIESAEGIEDRILHDGDLLMSHINSMQYLGRTVMYREEPGDCFIHGMNLLRLKADRSRVDPCYAEVFFQSPAFIRQIGKIAKKSVNQASFSTAALKDLVFPILELDRQREIARLFQTISEKQDNLELQSSKFEHLVKSGFVEMFGTILHNSRGWNTDSLGAIAPVEYRAVPNEGTTWQLNLDAIKSDSGAVVTKKYIDAHEVRGSVGGFAPGQVLYSKLRPNLNKVVLPDEKGVCTTELLPLSPKNDISPVYLASVLRSPEFVSFASLHTSGAKMPRVDMKAFRSFVIPVPPIALQHQFADFVAQVDKLGFDVRQQIEMLETLKKSLMQEYFG